MSEFTENYKSQHDEYLWEVLDCVEKTKLK